MKKTMTVVSSQQFIDWDIVAEKREMLENNEVEYVEIPVLEAEYQDMEGNDLFIMIDKHHTLQAAKELGIEIIFDVVANDDGNAKGYLLFEEQWQDTNWYYVSTDVEQLFGGFVW